MSCKDPERRRAYAVQYYAKNRERLKKRARECDFARMCKARGLTEDEYNEMMERQDGKCAICFSKSIGKSLHLDHDHVTGKVRGLLCYHCNVGIGYLRDDQSVLLSAVEYLKRYA